MNDETIQSLEMRKNNFFRDRYRWVMKWLSFMVFMSVGLSLILGYLSLQQRTPDYYATTTTGEVIPLYSLAEPVVTSDYIKQWASLRARDIYNLSFANYQDQLNQLQQYFTDAGWGSFKAVIQKSDLVKQVSGQKLDTSAVIYKPPVILAQMLVDGRFTWRIQLPLLVTFTSASEQTQAKYIVTMDIQRVPVIDAAKGIQIKNFNVQSEV